MKTQSHNSAGLRNRSERLGTQAKDTFQPVDFSCRRRNRFLPTSRLLHLLGTRLPDVYDLAQVVGRWVWVQFKAVPPAELRRQLAEFGFHWNRQRQAWQHPCGCRRPRASSHDPRRRYFTYFPADVNPA